jgi:hypothetical protein
MTVDREDKQVVESNQNFGDSYYKSHGIPYSPSIINRFVLRIKQTFQYWNIEDDRGLSGRAQAIIPRVEVLIDQLRHIDEGLKSHVLFSQYITQPLLREGVKLKADIIASGAPISHQLTSHYILWIDRSYRWIARYYQYDVSTLNHAVIDHIIKETQSHVEKDLHLVNDYIKQQLYSLDVSKKQVEDITSTICLQLDPVIDAMKTMENTQPRGREADCVKDWREAMDMLRQKFFDQCLEIVDSVIEFKTPRLKSQEKHDHLVSVLDSILSLENRIDEVIHGSETISTGSALKHSKRKIAALHQQAHKISLDIRLSQELFDRVQDMMHALNKYYTTLP